MCIHHTYTDQVSDYESDLLYYNARYYNPSLKTFTSPDPVAEYTPEQVLATPQLLNTYSYVANNPIVHVDPSGGTAIAAPLLAPVAGLGPIGWIAIGAITLGSAAYSAHNFDYGKLETGIIQPTKQELLETPLSYQDPNDLKTPRNGAPKWQKYGWLGLTTSAVLADKYIEYKEQKSGVEMFQERSQSQQSNKQNPVIKNGNSKSNSSGPRYATTISALEAASRALDSGDYSSTIKHLQKASDSLNQ